MPQSKHVLYTVIGLAVALYCMAALSGSDAGHTRWALMFVLSSIIIYELALARKGVGDGEGKEPGGLLPPRVRILTLVLAVAALVATLWAPVGRHSNLMSAREYVHGVYAHHYSTETEPGARQGYVSYLQPLVSSASTLYIREFTEAREAGALKLLLAEASAGERAADPRVNTAGQTVGRAKAVNSLEEERRGANPSSPAAGNPDVSPNSPSSDPLAKFRFDEPDGVPGNISTPLDDPDGIVVSPAVPNDNEGEVPGPVKPLHLNPDPYSDSLE